MIVMFPFIILSIILTASQAFNSHEGCNSPSCLREVERINAQIDPNVNPCDDFYRFSCGKSLPTTNVEKLGKFEELAKKAKKEILEEYKAPINPEQHQIVQAAKELFHACLDLPKIEEDNLETIKNVLNVLGGGWPLVVGDEWKEADFDWLEATYRLRELGYPYSIFLDLGIEDDPQDETRSILKVQIPSQIYENYKGAFEQKKILEKVVTAFGEDRYNVSNDLENLIDFEEQLRKKAIRQRWFPFSIYTVDKFQGVIGSINWLDFLNKVSGPEATISSEFVITAQEDVLGQYLDVIGKASKRTQANYLMWKVVEEMIPYLTSELRNLILPDNELKVPREVFCLNVTQERFTPSPIDILLSRKIPNNIKLHVTNLGLDIRDALLDGLNNSWLSNERQETVAEKLRKMVMRIGQPDDNESLLDDLVVDMREIPNKSFLNLLSQANRNHISLIFSRLNKTNFDKEINYWYLKPASYNIEFKIEANLLSIPQSQLFETVFDSLGLNCFNYGIFGKEIGKSITDLMLKYVTNAEDFLSAQKLFEGSSCLIEDIQKFQQLITSDQTNEMVSNIVGAKVAYSAYQKWVKSKGEEKVLGMNYTTEQLFWISTVDCKYFPEIPPPEALQGVFLREYEIKMSVYRDFPRTLAVAVMRNSPNFAEDFNCPLGSPMNPLNRCKIF